MSGQITYKGQIPQINIIIIKIWLDKSTPVKYVINNNNWQSRKYHTIRRVLKSNSNNIHNQYMEQHMAQIMIS